MLITKPIIWLTGQPGAGKTVLGTMLYKKYQKHTPMTIMIDGDDLREKTGNFDYTPEGRNKNILNAQMLARYLNKSGFVVIVSLVSPYRDMREKFKKEFGSRITEIYVHCKDARGREDYHASDYEPPLMNFLDVDTTIDDPNESFKKITKYLEQYTSQ
jgi:adenylylsulfate kinase